METKELMRCRKEELIKKLQEQESLNAQREEELTLEITVKDKEILGLKEKNGAYSSEIQSLNTFKEEISQRYAELNTNYNKATVKNQKLAEEVDPLKKEISTLKASLEESKSDTNRLLWAFGFAFVGLVACLAKLIADGAFKDFF